jgi:Glutaredoxin-like domain (DUF836)
VVAVRLTLYSKANCHLCEEAIAKIDRLRGRGYDLETVEVDITSNPALFERFRYVIPVVELPDGQTLQAPISEYKLEQLLKAYPLRPQRQGAG